LRELSRQREPAGALFELRRQRPDRPARLRMEVHHCGERLLGFALGKTRQQFGIGVLGHSIFICPTNRNGDKDSVLSFLPQDVFGRDLSFQP